MKKRSKEIGFWIAILILLIIIIIIFSFFYDFFYFNSFHNKIRAPNDAEKQKAIEILNKSVGIDNTQLKFGYILPLKNKEIIEVQVSKDSSRITYVVDLTSGRAVKK